MMAKSKTVRQFCSNGEKVIFRYPRIGDLGDMMRNINSLVDERAYIATERRQTKAGEKKWLAALLSDIRKKKKVALVVVIGGRVVGVAQVDRNSREAFSHVGSLGIGIVKEARHRGIGRRLLLAVIAEARKAMKIKIVSLSAVAKNRTAVKCYRKCGFKKTETMRGGIKYYGKYLNRIRMVKYL
jgi:L-amino acid N-acyltransferase YncA